MSFDYFLGISNSQFDTFIDKKKKNKLGSICYQLRDVKKMSFTQEDLHDMDCVHFAKKTPGSKFLICLTKR